MNQKEREQFDPVRFWAKALTLFLRNSGLIHWICHSISAKKKRRIHSVELSRLGFGKRGSALELITGNLFAGILFQHRD
ncbi:MAG: hypothetical protein ACR2H1_07750, partial [Limisphaerales bacterium]